MPGFAHILYSYLSKVHNQTLTNAAGITKHFKRWSYRHVCYHLYVGVEVLILQIIMSHLMHDNRGGMFLLHDGFATPETLDTERLDELVKKATRYEVKYDKQQV